MKVKDLAAELNTTQEFVEHYIATSTPYDVDYRLLTTTIPDEFVPDIKRLFLETFYPEAAAEAAAAEAAAAAKAAEAEAAAAAKAAEAEAAAAAETARMQEQKQAKQMAMAQMLISSGFNFEGYRIVKYSGYISGDDAIQVDRGTDGIFGGATDVGAELMRSLTVIRRNALNELKEAAYALGCNAVIGVDFDYLTLDPETANWNGGTTYQPYIFGVTANGNAVIIEKIEE